MHAKVNSSVRMDVAYLLTGVVTIQLTVTALLGTFQLAVASWNLVSPYP